MCMGNVCISIALWTDWKVTHLYTAMVMQWLTSAHALVKPLNLNSTDSIRYANANVIWTLMHTNASAYALRATRLYGCPMWNRIGYTTYLESKASVTIVVGVMKMWNTAPRAGLEPRSLAFWASMLPLHHIDFPDFTIIPTPTCLFSSLPQRSVQNTTLVSLEL